MSCGCRKNRFITPCWYCRSILGCGGLSYLQYNCAFPMHKVLLTSPQRISAQSPVLLGTNECWLWTQRITNKTINTNIILHTQKKITTKTKIIQLN